MGFVAELLCFGGFDDCGSDVDEFTSAFAFGKDDSSVNQGIDCVVFAHADILSGMVDCAALAFDDVTCFCKLATEYFDAESFAF